ncbi:MAG TPA: MBL fold metallo-hydrolase [Longimicrobiales bacterium]|nr:MBL fold metallo-hydrolase [Longimicrobiales bacterium]
MPRPSHHRPDGRFRNPWPEAAGDDRIRSRIREVAWEWLTKSLPPDPRPADLPVATADLALPTAAHGELRITWVGHATHIIQLPGLNVLTDPMWSDRASPLASIGSRRFVPPSPGLQALPPVHAVLLSHDHYDHLDRHTARALRDRFGADLPWYAPLGYRSWFDRIGIRNVVELDWWEGRELGVTGYRVVAAPARHWTRRTPWSTNRRLWCSWALLPVRGPGFKVYFGGDSAYASVFREIGHRLGPFDASVIPIGAYEPRWFMSASHMNPEEAVRAYEDLGREGAFLPSHWGTFRLTFEDPLEPPSRLRAEWSARGLEERLLHVPRHGETVTISRSDGSERSSK